MNHQMRCIALPSQKHPARCPSPLLLASPGISWHLSPRATFERRMGCVLVDTSYQPCPPADWYMDVRLWFDAFHPFNRTESATYCLDGRQHPTYGAQLIRAKEAPEKMLTEPTVLTNGHPGMGMMLPIFKGNMTAASALRDRQAALMGVFAAMMDFTRLADFIDLEVLLQGMEYSLEMYDVTATDVLPGSSTPLGPRLLYGAGDLPQGNPMHVNKLIPPSNETMLQPHRHKAVHQINLTDSSRTYQLCFQGSDTAHSMTAIFLGLIILVVAALLAAIGVSVTVNTRRLREKTDALEALKEQAEVAERNKSVFVANTAHELRTPINGMEGLLKHLDERGLDEEQRDDMGSVVEQAEKILSLVNTVLDVCKAEAGRLHLESLPFDLRSWLRDVLHPHVQAARERGLTCNHPPSLPSLSRPCLDHLFLPVLLFMLLIDSSSNNHKCLIVLLVHVGAYAVTWNVDGDVPSVVVGDYLRLQQVVNRIVGEHGMGVGEPLIRTTFWEHVGQRGLVRAVIGACHERMPWVLLRGLSAQCLGCYWLMPPVQEGRQEQEDSEEREGREEREEGEERVSVREQSAAYNEIGGDGGGERPGGGEVGNAGCRSSGGGAQQHMVGVAGAPVIPLRPRAAVQGATRHGDDAASQAATTATGDDAVGAWRRAVERCWRVRGREQGTDAAEGGGGRRCVVVVTCEDTGCGIAEEEQHHVFQAFMQASRALALKIRRAPHGWQVALMGGSIGLLSTESHGTESHGTESHGTTLHVALPMAVADATAAASVCGNSGSGSATISAPQAACAAFSSSGDEAAVPRAVETKSASDRLKELLQGKAILVVDDNAINRRVAASTLTRYGAEVALAESGEAALRLLQASRPPLHAFRLVLMDLQMPGLDGYQTTARLRALEATAHTGQEGVQGGQRVHVVAMTADVDSTVVARATEAGMDGAVQKPLNERLLLRVLSTLNGL
ncbi:unnamed protein product [Closterium sp. Yama58-4]|nr:unnamed protein product [Closterium sp. Yama58-4]